MAYGKSLRLVPRDSRPAGSQRTWVVRRPLSNRQILKVGSGAATLCLRICEIQPRVCVVELAGHMRDPLRRRAWFQCRFSRGEQPSVLRIKFKLPHRSAVLSVDQDSSNLLRTAVEFLAPLPQGNENREDAAALRRQHIF